MRSKVLAFILWALSVIFVAGTPSCQSDGGVKEHDADMAGDINKVMEAHTTELMAIPGVVGVAIGETPDGTPAILVLVEEKTAEITQAVPRRLEGHPVVLYESGKIDGM